MSRALVLGGGGPLGVGWEAGLVVGLAGGGVDLGEADAIVGTSAGSIVGSQLAAGSDLSSAVALLAAATGDADPEANQAGVEGLQQLMVAVGEAITSGGLGAESRARLGRIALDAPTVSEEEYLHLFAVLAGGEWPARFACTAVDAGTGEFRVWDAATGVPLAKAVASSCAVPTIYPPVTIGSARYMDGGMRDILNADVAAGHDTVLVVSCTVLELPAEILAFTDPALQHVLAATTAQLDALRDRGAKVEVIGPGPGFLEVSGWGLNLMDFTKTAAAYDAGVAQGATEAARLAGFWAA